MPIVMSYCSKRSITQFVFLHTVYLTPGMRVSPINIPKMSVKVTGCPADFFFHSALTYRLTFWGRSSLSGLLPTLVISSLLISPGPFAGNSGCEYSMDIYLWKYSQDLLKCSEWFQVLVSMSKYLNIRLLLTMLIQKALPCMLHSQAPQIHTEPSSHQRTPPSHGNPPQSPLWR